MAGLAVLIGAAALRVAVPSPVHAVGHAAVPLVSPQAENQREGPKQEAAKTAASGHRRESILVLHAARPGGASPQAVSGQGRTNVSFPMEFRAGDGETVGAIRALVTLPAAGWKFSKAEFPSGSRLKASIRQEKKSHEKTNPGQAQSPAVAPVETIELSITAGAHVIRDGIIGELQFSVASASSIALPNDSSVVPVVKILATSPPQTEEVRQPGDKSDELSPSAPANPSVSCFFFSH